MSSFASIVDQHLRVLVGLLGEMSAPDAAGLMPQLSPAHVVAVIEETTGAIRELEALRTVASGVAAAQSTRDAGQGGLAQRRGHRSAVSLIQDLTGMSRTQAAKVTSLGQSLIEGAAPDGSAVRESEAPDAGEADDEPGSGVDSRVAERPWHACLGDAYTAALISVDQQTAIRRGLGEPPTMTVGNRRGVEAGGDKAGDKVGDGEASGVDREGEASGVDGDGEAARRNAEARAAWAVAAQQLIDEAGHRTVEDLATAARAIRDQLDPEGAARRYEEQFEGRSLRTWTDTDGVQCAKIRFEPGGGAALTAIVDAAMRPRRGGPRFVDPSEKTAAEQLVADPRSNEQLAYDLLMDVLHAGALADAATVFGTRQAGVRVVVTEGAHRAARAGLAAVAVIEDTNRTVPAAFAAQHACDAGTVDCVVDGAGNPLDLGRSARLFSAKQRVALAIRDGGCAWTGCDRPPSYCEVHHIDKFSEGGRTDVDRGILLCRFHHMNLHHHGWWITRDGTGPFVLHSPEPGVAPMVLQPRLERRYAFGDLQPPPTRFRPAA